MTTTLEMPKSKVHEGRNLKRIREILHIKQEVLADALDMSQQNVSLLEQKETIEPELLEKAAKAIGVTPEAIRSFNEDAAISIIASTLHDTSIANNNFNPVFNFNPLDKIMELYERMLKSEKEKVELLEKQLQEKQGSKK